MQHKWGDIRMTGRKTDILDAMTLVTRRKPASMIYFADVAIEHDSSQTQQKKYAQMDDRVR
jgi:hypothetical protein